MTELTEAEKQEIIKALDELEATIKESRGKCKNPECIKLLDELEEQLNTLKK